MIISLEDAKSLIDFKGWSDEKISRKLIAIEQMVRTYTNNNFQDRHYRTTAEIIGGGFICDKVTPFEVGDTIQVSNSEYNDGLYTITAIENDAFEVAENVKSEQCVLVTKVKYPADVIDCCLNLIAWEIENRDKIGIASETLSRHSVSYVQQNDSNSVNGYPKALINGLNRYRKARF